MKPSKPLKFADLKKLVRKGSKRYPTVTIAYYGPDNTRASKVAIGFIAHQDADAMMRSWFADDELEDVRYSDRVVAELIEYVNSLQPGSVVIADKILGCPHQEGIDYPDGEVCGQCEYWMTKDRWSGETIQ